MTHIGEEVLVTYSGGRAVHFASHLIKNGFTFAKGVVSKGGKRLFGTELDAELKAAAKKYKAARGLYDPCSKASVGKATHAEFGPIFKQKDGKWWARDKAVHGGHGGSVWKVFRQDKSGLTWIWDADQFGDYITGKHKGPPGIQIPKSHLGGISGW